MKRQQPCIVITGAAAGIGRATAHYFARKGWQLGVFDIDASGLQQLTDSLGDKNIIHGRLEVCSVENWATVLSDFFQRTGRIDVLFNNAGILSSGAFSEIPVQRHHQMVDVNIKGMMNGCYAGLPYLRQTPGSRVINMASASAIYGQPQLATYSATKFAVRGFTEALDLEWQALDIRVMDIMPLFVQTAMVKNMQAKAVARLGVHLTPENIAEVVWKAATFSGRRSRVHWFAGRNTHLFYTLSGITPDWLVRQINHYLTAS